MTALGSGVIWPVYATGGSLSMLFVDVLPTLEQWPTWARDPRTWRMRKLGE